MMETKERVGLISLGCPKNRVDSEAMLALLQAAGYQLTNRPEEAELLIINTCGFIGDAKKESVDTILEFAQYKTKAACRSLIVTGCLAQRYPDELRQEIPEIDALVGTADFPNIVRIVAESLAGAHPCLVGAPDQPLPDDLPRVQSTAPHTAYLKIAEGCGHRCSYCIIPVLRGNLQSRPREAIVREAKALAADGVRELNLIAQDTTQYGIDRYGSPQLAALLTDLASIEEIRWLRLLYAYPTNFPPELIETIAREPKIVKYLDLPLQHCSDTVLRRMNRRFGKRETEALLQTLRERIPGLVLRTTFIVGFPGETEAQFEELLDFLRAHRFDRVGIFPYSQEEGTPAGAMPDQIPEAVKTERYRRAMALQQSIAQAANQALLGQEIEVMLEGPSPRRGYATVGRSYRDAPQIDGLVFLRRTTGLPGDIVRVRVTGAEAYDLFAE